jgi:hypothetical protein
MTRQQFPPLAVCTVSGHFSYGSIDSSCSQRPDGKTRCKGIMGSAVGEDDWKPCSTCVDGIYEGKRCELCQGWGWEYVRR